MSNEMKEIDYIDIINIYKNRFVSFEEITDDEKINYKKEFNCRKETKAKIILQLSKPDYTEEKIIKRESFQSLSKEAKEIINIIINQPKEIRNILATPKLKLITKRSIFLHLKKVFNSEFLAKSIIEEIETWVNQL